MLPDGFEWRPWSDGDWHLYCQGRSIGYVTRLENGARACRCPQVGPTYAFGPSFEAGIAYMERWATQHQARILEIVHEYELRNSRAHEAMRAQPPQPPIQTTHHRRHGRRAF